MTTTPVSPVPEPKSWWGRNWKWFVPLGCVGVLAVVLASLGLLVGIIFGAIRQSDIAQLAIQRAQQSEELEERLGAPIEPRWWLSGNIEMDGAGGTASLAIPLKGSRARGTLYVEGTKSTGRWSFDQLVFETEGGERLDLLEDEGER